MALWIDARLFPSTRTFDDRSKQTSGAKVKFKRAFQFLHWLLVHRVYGMDTRQASKSPSFEVFLGGSCNPTTWRKELAIPHFQSHSISCYNPQVDQWTPDLVEIEHCAKESASLLFFVIDHDTRSLAAIAEVCYLAARGRKIIVVISSMPTDARETKFMQHKIRSCLDDDRDDYKNACEARRTLRVLLQSLHVPVFDNIRLALEYATLIMKLTKRTASNSTEIDPRDKSTPENLESPADLSHDTSAVSITPSIRFSPTFSSFLRSKLPFHSHHTQISCCTNESDDDGYGSLLSGNRTLSRSSSSANCSEFGEYAPDQHEEGNRSRVLILVSIAQRILANPLLDLICSFVLRCVNNVLPSAEKRVDSDLVTARASKHAFDLYLAAGAYDQCWLDSVVFPLLETSHIHYVKRHVVHAEDQSLDTSSDLHTCQQSHLLYYLINGRERLSELTTELAFLIGERKHRLVVYLEPKIDDDAECMITRQERQDVERSRKYLEDLAQREQISLYHSRDQSWQHVLSCLSH